MIGLLGKKIGMTQLFDESGKQVPVTVLEAGPCFVSALRTQENDGYCAVQLAFDGCRESRLTKPRLGQFKKSGVPASRFVREIRTEEVEGLKTGTKVTVDSFEEGDYVDVEGVSIGRGFQSVIKRHNFKGGESAHGSKHGREVGSTGQSAYPSRVIKGKKMPGQMGNKKVLIQNLQVAKVDKENHLLTLRGAVPGYDGSYLVIRSSLKRGTQRKWKLEKTQEAAVEATVKEETASQEPK